MESLEKFKQQALEIINTLNVSEIETTIEVMRLIISGNGIKIHLSNDDSDQCSANLSNTYLIVTKNDKHIFGSAGGHLATDSEAPENMCHISATPYQIPIENILPEYIRTNAQKFNYQLTPSVLKSRQEVLFKTGDQVFYQNYIFYFRYNGSVALLYANKEDYLKKKNQFCVAMRLVLKIVPLNKLDQEFKSFIQRQDYWTENPSGQSSSESSLEDCE